MKVGVLLSGGVDSAVALYSLLEAGHEVIAYHIKTVPDEFYLSRQIKHKVCCSPADTFDAQLIAQHFKVPFKVLHIEEFFHRNIIQYYLSEYKNGRTPNPCYLCNRLVKFGLVMDLILKDGADMVASGHYARIVDGKLYRAIDREKDQSYFLASIEKERLSKIVFPNGDKTKVQVREIASRVKIHVHSKEESQDLCFIPDGDQERFFKEHGIEFDEGPIYDSSGKELGKHRGLIHYTIGQRKLGVSLGSRMYVVRIDAKNNAIIVGKEEEVYRDRFTVTHFNPLVDLPGRFTASVKVRKNSDEVACSVSQKDGVVEVKTKEPIFAVTPGQVAVFYDGDLVLGSGIIEEVL
ncbi:tRNA 2-thiouridine(34) synthase MnmA [Thermotoga sp. Ku-13t]|uniref:tRNA 2-thiouridine(34) synthase MnmA n=1 Tax=Thermotoga sp. Ku-13t TaxID=1755813 RepID=UPI0013EBF258|nr:tRNA 2-thiouridine(34) synthase MnmA [Thermotoga sp. Ku-13t]